MSFTKCKTENNIFFRRAKSGKEAVYILTYVDDLLIIGLPKVTKDVFMEMSEHFLIKDLGGIGSDGGSGVFLVDS